MTGSAGTIEPAGAVAAQATRGGPLPPRPSASQLYVEADSLAIATQRRLGFWAGSGIEQVTSAATLVLAPVSLGLTLAGVPLAALALLGISVGIVAATIGVGIVIELAARGRRAPELVAMQADLQGMQARLGAARQEARAAGDSALDASLGRVERRVAVALGAVRGGAKHVVLSVCRGLFPGPLGMVMAGWQRLRGAPAVLPPEPPTAEIAEAAARP